MTDLSFLDWPFFEDRHRALAETIDRWATTNVAGLVDHSDVDGSCRRLVAALGKAGFLAHVVPEGYGGPQPTDRKSTRLNSSHVKISYAVFCLKKKSEHDQEAAPGGAG